MSSSDAYRVNRYRNLLASATSVVNEIYYKRFGKQTAPSNSIQ